MLRPASHEDYVVSDEVLPGVFISSDDDSCDIHIVDDVGEILTYTFDEVCECPQTLEAVILAVALAAMQGPQAVRINIQDHGGLIKRLYENTQSRFSDT